MIWGENFVFEYGGDKEVWEGFVFDEKWLSIYGVIYGIMVRDWVGDDLSEKDLIFYFGFSERELFVSGVLVIFFGYYFFWDFEVSFVVVS